MGGITKMAASVPVVPMDRGNNTTCTIDLHGATIVSWRVNNQEQLFVSKKSVFDGRKPIRGGIPFVFPQFGQWNYGMNGPPYHGFARISKWQLEKGPERMPSGDIEAIFSLSDSDFTYSMWQHHFKISYRIILREKELHPEHRRVQPQQGRPVRLQRDAPLVLQVSGCSPMSGHRVEWCHVPRQNQAGARGSSWYGSAPASSIPGV